LDAFQYEVYNKVEFDLNNIDEDFKNQILLKPFQFIFENEDTADNKHYLPVYISESISDYFYRKQPKAENEVIKATKVSGVKNDSFSQLLGDMYQNLNIYENNIILFNKSFISPFSNLCFFYYHYFLVDSAYIGNNWCYKIQFQPQRKQELTFKGEFWVNDTTYAIRKFNANIAKDANINFITSLKIDLDFNEVQKEVWMNTREKMIVDGIVLMPHSGKMQELRVKKLTTYKNIVINKPLDDTLYHGPNNIVVAEDVNKKDDNYWQEARHDTLTKSENAIYSMVDSLKKLTWFKVYKDIFSGYLDCGLFEIGPYFSMYSNNPIEGNRFRFGGRTTKKFSNRTYIKSYIAYGFKDDEIKYNVSFQYFLTKSPRQLLTISSKKDVVQLGQRQYKFSDDNILNSFFRRHPANKLNGLFDFMTSYEREWFNGFSNNIEIRRSEISPLGDLKFNQISYSGEVINIPRITTFEITLNTHFAYKEKFLSGEFNRVSLGSKFPSIDIRYIVGLKGVINSDYEYQKCIISFKHKLRVRPLGYMKIRIEGGKIFGTLPYPMLELHNGNETFFYDEMAFNTMNYFEFASDEYVSCFITHHFEGAVFNKIPLFRRLKWREVASIKCAIGHLDKRNIEEMQLPVNMHELNDPYTEASVGIENVFKVLRIDALWRLSYLDNPGIMKFGIRGSLEINF